MNDKICSKCKLVKNLSEFSHNKRMRDGLSRQCRTCYSEYFQKTKDNRITTMYKWVEKNREKSILLNTERRAKEEGLPFNLSLEDIQIPKKCPILGVKLDLSYKRNQCIDRELRPSVDRIIPELGYIKGNIRIISSKANRKKQDSNIRELQKIIKYIKESMKLADKLRGEIK